MLSHRKLYINQMDNPISNNLFANHKIVPMLSINSGNKQLNMNLVIDYDSNDQKRRYLSDLKPFSTIFTIKSIGLDFLRAALIPFSLIVQEYNTFVIAQSLNKNEEDDDSTEEEDFDWTPSIEKHYFLVIPLFIKNVTVKILHRCILEGSKQYLSTRVVDKLSKDVYQSLLRKIDRFPSRFYTSYCIFFTFYKSTVVNNLALSLCDLGYFIYDATFNMKENSIQQKGLYILKSIVKRTISYYFCSLTGALGK